MRLAWATVFIALVYVAGGQAQPAQKIPRIGFIATTSPVAELRTANPAAQGFARGMAELGYLEGKTVIIEWRTAEGRFERFPEIVRELIAARIDVLVTVTNPMTQAAKEVTQTLPIVMAASSAPVELGLVKSLARPGGNVTGLTIDAGPEIFGKRLQYLKQVVPSAARVAVVGFATGLEGWTQQESEASGRAAGVRLVFVDPPHGGYERALLALAEARVHAIFVAQSAQNYGNRKVLADFGAKARVPLIYPARDYVIDAGGLISYGPDISDIFRRAARYVDRILRGARAGDLPIERPVKYELVINLKAAKALGLSIPNALLLQADHVVQ